MRTSFVRSVTALAVSVPALVASAGPIANGTYLLHNHPDGAERPPLYGMRLDELFNATANHDIFTFNFDHALSNMRMDVTNTTIHIYGVAYGGRDTGSAYANDTYLGVYAIDFTYSNGVGTYPGDDDRYVNPGYNYNYGSITSPANQVISLRDGHYGNGQPDFRLGDEDNDLGHRGYSGISGWGWLFFNTGTGYVNYTSNDWLFTATLMPTPGAAALAGLAALGVARRNRR